LRLDHCMSLRGNRDTNSKGINVKVIENWGGKACALDSIPCCNLTSNQTWQHIIMWVFCRLTEPAQSLWFPHKFSDHWPSFSSA
jgi:DNA gyrase inhibitor GyrI